jgi:hypothetical protein
MNFRVVEKHPLDAMAGAFDETARHQRRFADRAHHLVHHDRRIALRHVDPPDFVLARQQLGLSDGVARLCTSRRSEGAESLSLGTEPVTETPSALLLSGALRGLRAEGVGRDEWLGR